MREKKRNRDTIREEADSLRARTYRMSDQLIRSCGSLSILAQKILALALTEMKENKDEALEADISGRVLRMLLQNNSDSFYRQVRKACNSRGLKQSDLMSLRVSVCDEGTDLRQSVHVVLAASFKNGRLHIVFNPAIKDKLLCTSSPSAELCLGTVMEFRSVYSVRLYERLQYETDRHGVSAGTGGCRIVYSLEEVRNIFGLQHESEKKEWDGTAYPYKLFHDFRCRVLEKAAEEINSAGPMRVVFDLIPSERGRKTASVAFTVSETENAVEWEQNRQNLMSETGETKGKTVPADIYDLLEEDGLGIEAVKAACDAAKIDIEKMRETYRRLGLHDFDD